jgi:hypothetical protein
MVKKHLLENHFTSGAHHLLKLVAFVLRRRVLADDQVTKTETSVHRFSIVRRNPQDGQAGNWVISVTWQCGESYISSCLFSPTNFNCCRSSSPVIVHVGDTSCTNMLNRLEEDS